ncbi:MAG: class I adenylate-forming enzyme family protein [Candidatus Promineifilaceae bacterium]
MLIEQLERTIQRVPEKTALVCGDSQTTYQMLYKQIGQFSHGLKELGVASGETIIVALPNSVEFVISFYAVAALHARLLPVNPFLTEMEMVRYLDTHPHIATIITDSAWLGAWQRVLSRKGRSVTLVVVNRPALTVGAEAGAVDFHGLMDGVVEAASADAYPHNFLIQYSSGSTGLPKQIERTQENLCHQANNCTETIGVTSADSILAAVPLYHAYGIGECLLAAMTTGATLVIMEQAVENGIPVQKPFIFRHKQLADLIDQHQITILPLVPYMVSLLAGLSADSTASLSSVRLCFSAGTFLSQDVFVQFKNRWGVSVRQLYGCTEAGAIAVNLEDEANLVFNTVGRPMKNTDIQILGESGHTAPVRTVGELALKSRTVAAGNVDNYFLTGDLAQRDEQGRIFIIGRKGYNATLQKQGPLKQDPALAA